MKIHLNHFTCTMFIFILFFLSVRAGATNYYVNAANGNDNNNGTSISTPWETISKVNSTNFQPGDVISFNRGDIWRESLTLSSSSSGSAGNYIKLTAYGSGNKPQINGSNIIGGSWTDLGSNVWSTTVTGTIYSNAIWFGKSDTTHWGYEQSSSSACTQDYYWYQSGNTFYVYATSNPSDYYQWIQYAVRGSQISKQYIWLDNLDFAYGGSSSQDYNLRTNNAHYMKITNCIFRYSGADNIYFLSSYLSMSNTLVYESIVHGIYCGAYGSYVVRNDTIQNSTFWNNYYNNIDLMNVNQISANAGHHVIRYNYLKGRTGNYPSYANTNANISLIGNNTDTQTLVNIKIYGNILTDAPVAGILLSNYDDSVYIYNNTFYNNKFGVGRNYFVGEDGYYWIKNNIIANSYYYAIDIASGMNCTFDVDYNQYYNNGTGLGGYFGHYNDVQYSSLSTWQSETGFDTHGYQSNPNFADAANGDFTISSGDAIDNGLNLGGLYNRDILGISRPQGSGYDLGAYEKTQGVGGGNNPPNQPTNPSPADGAINQPVNTTLTWSCTDPDGDPLTYDVYFGDINNPPLVSGNQSNASYYPGQLNNNTTYYWKIVAKDNQGGITPGPVWSFTIIAADSVEDVTPPELVGVQSVQTDQVVLDFSEPLDTASAGNPENYVISDQIQVLNASLNTSHKRIILTTTEQLINYIYTIEISGVTDTAGNVISNQANSAFYKILEIGSTGYRELLIDNVNASATTDTNTSPAKTLDGLVNSDPDPFSRWAAQIMPQWIQYDLGSTEIISLIAVSFYQWNAGRIYHYSIQTSDDSFQWNEVVSNAASSTQEWTFNEFTNLSARYVRITCLNSNQGDWAGIWEARIFEPDDPTAVNYILFTAKLDENNNVVLNWKTATEQNCKEFNITRKEGNDDFTTIGTITGHGTITESQSYTFTDNTVRAGKYSYRLEEVDFSGNINYSNTVEIGVNEPQKFNLEQNYPNPFNPTTTISFSVPEESHVILKVFDILGNEITTLVNEKKQKGYYKIEFNAAFLPSGIYLVRMETKGFFSIKKMILLK